jgi:glycosyltransferase involved in cell wall biosynthesis
MQNSVAPVSAVIAAYNAEDFIAATIASAQAQTVRVAEIIVVADGSTDDTAKIAESMGARVFNDDCRGLARKRNKCIRESTQPWIAFLDSDDLWEAGKIERQMEMAAADPELALITCDYSTFSESGNVCDSALEQYAAAYRLQPKRDVAHGSVIQRLDPRFDSAYYFLLSSNVMVRRDVLLRTGLFDESLDSADDFDCFMRVLAHSPMGLVERILVKRRHHNDSTSNRHPAATLSCLAATYKVLEHPENYPAATVELCRQWLPGNLRHAGARLVWSGEAARGRDLLRQSARLEFNWRTLLALTASLPPGGASRKLMQARYYVSRTLGI